MYVFWSQLLLAGGFILSQGMQIKELSNKAGTQRHLGTKNGVWLPSEVVMVIFRHGKSRGLGLMSPWDFEHHLQRFVGDPQLGDVELGHLPTPET